MVARARRSSVSHAPPTGALQIAGAPREVAGDHHGAKAGASSSPWLPRSPAPPPASRRPSKASSALVSSNRSSHGCLSPFDPADHRQPPPSAGSRWERVDPFHSRPPRPPSSPEHRPARRSLNPRLLLLVSSRFGV